MESLYVVKAVWHSPHFHHALPVVRCQTLYLRTSGLGQRNARDLGEVSLTGFETKPALVLGLNLGSPERVALGVQHRDVPVSRIRSSGIEFVDV